MRTARRMSWSLVALACTMALLVALPHLIGTTWSAVGQLLATVPLTALVGLGIVWIAGLWSHSFVLAASLPGLTKRRAMSLSLAGSAVSNVLPLGGAAGTGLNLAMVRSWGFTTALFTRFLTITQLLNVLSKLAVIGLAVLVGTVVHDAVPLPARGATLLAVPVLVLVGVVLVLLLVFVPGTAERCGRALTRITRRRGVGDALVRMRTDIAASFHGRWPTMTVGMIAYLILQAVLLALCFAALGSPLPATTLLAAFAAERLLTLIVVTPGGAGVVEAGTAAALVATGTDPAIAAAGLLLFRGFTYLMEIPVGGVILAGWIVGRSRPAELAEGHR